MTEATIVLTNLQRQQVYLKQLPTDGVGCRQLQAAHLPDGLYINTANAAQNDRQYKGKLIKN